MKSRFWRRLWDIFGLIIAMVVCLSALSVATWIITATWRTIIGS